MSGEEGSLDGNTPERSREESLEVLLDSFAERYRRGENPSLSEYAGKHPELAEKIREFFPALLLLGGTRSGIPNSGDSAGTLSREFAGADPVLWQLGEYRLIREIGRGGMGVVYEAEQTSLARRVALKVLPFHLLTDERRLERFHREAQAAARLQHPGIVPIYGFGVQGGIHYYAMQFVDGRSLDRVISEIQQHGGADPRKDEGHHTRAARITLEVARALSYAHDRGILHRDIKPSNIIIGADDRVWVVDFGLAKASDVDSLTGSGEIVGTLRYMAPEQFSGRSDPRSDIYSLGLTLYELLALEPAHPDSAAEALMRKVTLEPPPAPRRIDPRIPRELEIITRKAMQREPEARYQSAAEMAADLEKFLAGGPVRTRLPGIGYLMRRFLGRHRFKLAAAVLLTASAGAVLAAWIWAHQPRGASWAAALDLDGDGDRDLVTINQKSNSASFLLNDGEGRFSVRSHIEAGNQPMSAALVDFDGDGDLDMAISSLRSGYLTMLRNRGAGSYERAGVVAAGAGTAYMDSGDIDGDGDADLVAAAMSKGVCVLRNQGGFEFSSAVLLPVSGIVYRVALGDLDGQSGMDLVAGSVSQSPFKNLAIFRNRGDGTFGDPESLDLGKPVLEVEASDLDGDLDVDLALTHYGFPDITLLWNDGRGAFREIGTVPVGSLLDVIAVADFDGDGRVDLAAAGGANYAGVSLGAGNREFRPGENLLAGEYPVWIEAADLDGDRDLDLAVVNVGSGDLTLFSNDSKGGFGGRQVVDLSPWWRPRFLTHP